MAEHGEKAQFNAYLGVWTNWSRGRVLGATLTLEPRYGLLLLSFTATFVGFVASRFWRILTFILHRVYSTTEARDALHHQRQAMLRNSTSAVSTLCTSLQLAWCWRAIGDGYLARTVPTIIFAVSVFCAFTVAGGFTSSISSGIGNDVLIGSPSCTLISEDVSSMTMEKVSVLYPWLSQSMNNAANYAQQCYSSNTTGALDCTTFVKSRLEFSTDSNATCPFSNNMCRNNDTNLLLDSGLISTDDLGVNLPSNQRMFYREVVHCAPLRTDGFATNVTTVHNNYTRYSYGDSEGASGTYNWTYEAENINSKYWRSEDNPVRAGIKGFILVAPGSFIANGTVQADYSDFISIPQLTLPDADLLMPFLSSDAIVFLNQTNDPWYRAIVPYDVVHFQGGQRVVYRPDEAASPMGCAIRHQYCNFNKECGSLASFADALYSAVSLFHMSPEAVWNSGSGASDNWDATTLRFQLFQSVIVQSWGIYDLIGSLGSSSLLSIQHLTQGYMGPLPDNQWQLDVSHWFSIRLASLQTAFVNLAIRPADEALLPYMSQVEEKTQLAMCKNQKILSTDYTSLSLFGLYFTYVAGIIVILASYTAEPLLGFFYSRRKYGEYKYLEWATNGTLQLQRLAYQGLGSEKWTNYTDDIPRTSPGYFLADLARAYPAGNDEDEAQEVKPAAHTTLASTTTPSVSEVSTNQGVSGQPSGAPSRPSSGVPEPGIPQPVPRTRGVFAPVPQPMSPSPQAMSPSLQAVLPSPRAVSPMSQFGAALGSQENHSPPNVVSFAGQMQDPIPEYQFRKHG